MENIIEQIIKKFLNKNGGNQSNCTCPGLRTGCGSAEARYELPVKHYTCMLVRREAEKPGEHLHRFFVLALVHACSIADAAHIFTFFFLGCIQISPMIPSIASVSSALFF